MIVFSSLGSVITSRSDIGRLSNSCLNSFQSAFAHCLVGSGCIMSVTSSKFILLWSEKFKALLTLQFCTDTASLVDRVTLITVLAVCVSKVYSEPWFSMSRW